MKSSLKESRSLQEIESRLTQRFSALFTGSGNVSLTKKTPSTALLLKAKSLEFQLSELMNEVLDSSKKINSLLYEVEGLDTYLSYKIGNLEERLRLSSLIRENNQAKAYFISLSDNPDDYIDRISGKESSFKIKGKNGYLSLDASFKRTAKISKIETKLNVDGLVTSKELEKYFNNSALVKEEETKARVYTKSPKDISSFKTRIVLDNYTIVGYLKLDSILLSEMSKSSSCSVNIKFLLNKKLVKEETLILNSRSTLYAVEAVTCNEVIIEGNNSLINRKPISVKLTSKRALPTSRELKSLVLEGEDEILLDCWVVEGGLDSIDIGYSDGSNHSIGVITSDTFIGKKNFSIEMDPIEAIDSSIYGIYEEFNESLEIEKRLFFPISLIEEGILVEELAPFKDTVSFLYYRPSLKVKSIIEIPDGVDMEYSTDGGLIWKDVGTEEINDFCILRSQSRSFTRSIVIAYSGINNEPSDIEGKISLIGYRSFSVNSEIPYRVKIIMKNQPGRLLSNTAKLNEIYLLVK